MSMRVPTQLHPRRSGGPARLRRVLTAGVIIGALSTAAGCTVGESSTIDTDELAADVDAYLETVDASDMVRAVLVYQDDLPVLERYSGATSEDHHGIASITKSIASALIGIAIGEGEIAGVDATLGELLPSYAAAMTPDVAAIPLQDVLRHTAGIAPGDGLIVGLEYWTEPDWVRAILEDRAARGPGDGFAYSNAGSHLLGAILVEATGRSVLDYARAKLFDPLGIDTEPALERVYTGEEENALELWEEYDAAAFAWPIDPQGHHETAGGIKLRPEDLATFGMLYLHSGWWGDRQIVPEEWVQESTTASVTTNANVNEYGYQWWVSEFEGEQVALAMGFHGQLIAILPDQDLVVVVASRDDLSDPAFGAKAFGEDEALTLVETVIAPAFTD